MYLTAQLVRNSVHEWKGINAFLYEEPHTLKAHPQPLTTRALLRAIEQYASAEKTRRGAVVLVPPGGNAIDAYIDIVTAGALHADALDVVEEAIQRELTLDKAAETVAWANQDLLVRAYVRPDLDPVAMLQQLMRSARDLVAHPRLDQLPIRIRELRRGDRSEFELDEESVERLRALYGEQWIAPRIGISDDVRDAFAALHGGDILAHLVTVMTGGLGASNLARLGDVEFVDEQARVIWPEHSSAAPVRSSKVGPKSA